MNENQGYTIFYNGGTQLRCPVCKNVVMDKFCPFCSNDMTGEFNLQYAEYMRKQNPPQYQQPYYEGMQYNNIPYNQGYPQNSYQQYPKKNKSNVGLIVGLCVSGAVLLGLAFVLIGLLNFSAVSNKPNYNTEQHSYKDNEIEQKSYYMPDGVSTDEYSKLKHGLSYAHVSSIIGGDGLLVNNGKSIKDEAFYTYAWPSEYNESSVVYITFTNDVVTDITLEGSLE